MFIIARRCLWIAIEVPRRSASKSPLRGRTLLNIPVLARFVVGRVQYRLWYFVIGHTQILSSLADRNSNRPAPNAVSSPQHKRSCEVALPRNIDTMYRRRRSSAAAAKTAVHSCRSLLKFGTWTSFNPSLPTIVSEGKHCRCYRRMTCGPSRSKQCRSI